MIDPITLLAFSMHSSPGVFALLLGSGVSKSSGIPTGWDIVIDLIRKLSILEEGTEAHDPESWFRSKYSSEPNYSDILEKVSRTPAERRNLLRQYFEPSEKDREDGMKVPSTAHRVIASLIDRGYIKVVITTNFDPLLEKACREIGLEPVVISDETDVSGAIPLIHSKCTIIKVNGDYLDERIRNTHEELSKYPKAINKLLDRVFDEFGLLVCGWSGEWGEALKKALRKCSNHGFQTYRTHIASIAKEPQQLISKRRAQTIAITGADSFFTEIDEKVTSLESIDEAHPISVKVAVETVKRYLSKDEFKIQLEDLFSEETERCYRQGASLSYLNEPGAELSDKIVSRLHYYENNLDILLSMCIAVAHYGDGKHNKLILKVIKRLAVPRDNGSTPFLSLSRYPLVLLVYSVGIVALAKQNYSVMREVLTLSYEKHGNVSYTVAEHVYPSKALSKADANKIKLRGKDMKFPMEEYLFDYLKYKLSSIIPDEDEFEHFYDKFDYFRSILQGYLRKTADEGLWAYPGPFLYRNKMPELDREFLEEYEHSTQNVWFLRDGLFGGSYEQFKETSRELKELSWLRNW